MVPVISFLGSQEGQKARHPKAGWQVVPLTGDMRQSYRLLPFLQFGYCCKLVTCLSISHSHPCLCLLLPSLGCRSWLSLFSLHLLYLNFWLLPSVPSHLIPGKALLTDGDQVVWHCSALFPPGPVLLRLFSFLAFTQSLVVVILALQLGISQLGQFSEPWLSPDRVSYSAALSGLAQFSDPLPDLRSHFCRHPASFPSHSSLALTCSCR